jgi:hypothetical protein
MNTTHHPAARIRELNDSFRKTFAGGNMVMTANVAALPEMVKLSALVIMLANGNGTTTNAYSLLIGSSTPNQQLRPRGLDNRRCSQHLQRHI